jgi:vacuolar iron transporter family protein
MHYNHEHKSSRIAWIRAVVLGANDGIVSTASLIIGVAAANTASSDLLLVGIAGLVAGAMSMAAGEYVSVSSQTDIEQAELALEQQHIDNNWHLELQELAEIYKQRGVESGVAQVVAKQLMLADPIGSHARDELGITEESRGNPLQAAIFSALSFSAGACFPLLAVFLVDHNFLMPASALISLSALVILGSVAAYVGGASVLKGASRVLFWGALAMAASAGVGHLFGVSL